MKGAINSLFIVLFGVATIPGCSPQDNGQTPPDSSWKEGLSEDVVKALSELSDADLGRALTQKACLVSDKPLGSMGRPPKVTVEGQEVFLCCEGCEDELRSNAGKYLAKLKSN